jgi:hypothetical protein
MLKNHHDVYEYQSMLQELMEQVDLLKEILNIDELHYVLYNCRDLMEYSKQLKKKFFLNINIVRL